MAGAARLQSDAFDFLTAHFKGSKLDQISGFRLEGKNAAVLFDVAHPLSDKARRLGNRLPRAVDLAGIAQLIEQRQTGDVILMAMGQEHGLDSGYDFSGQRRIEADLTVCDFALDAAVQENERIVHADGIAVSSVFSAAAESGQIYVVHRSHLMLQFGEASECDSARP